MKRSLDPVDNAPARSRWWLYAAGALASAFVQQAYRIGWHDGRVRGVDDTAAVAAVDAIARGAPSTRELIDELQRRTITLPGAPAHVIELSEAFACITREHNDNDALDARERITPGQ